MFANDCRSHRSIDLAQNTVLVLIRLKKLSSKIIRSAHCHLKKQSAKIPKPAFQNAMRLLITVYSPRTTRIKTKQQQSKAC